MAIPCALVYFVRRRRDVPFSPLFWLFGAFIVACGTTHLMEAIIFWWPAYRLAAVVKLATGVVSWTTVLCLLPVIPKALRLRTPEELEREVDQRTRMLRETTKQLETSNEQLAQARHQADLATAAKSSFLANMSHEIRTPMTAILGYTDLLLEDGHPVGASKSRVEAIRTIQRNGECLLSIINDILDLSKIEAGQLTVSRSAASPRRIIHDVCELMSVRAHDLGLYLKVECDASVPDVFHTDAVRLRQILINLVGNAVKFTERGGVSVRVHMSDDDADAKTMRFEVSDTGIGMPPEQAAQLFQPFHQADPTSSRKFGGTGLGLHISKRLAEMLGGCIDVTTEQGRGSSFTLTLPAGGALDAAHVDPSEDEHVAIATRQRPSAGDVALPVLDGARILLVEDGFDNQVLISYILRNAGGVVAVAENGRAALEKVTATGTADGRLRAPAPYDLILMDIQMPEMDGYTATRVLRERGWRGPIVALTAHAMAGDREKCLRAGCDDYMTKPINRTALLRLIVSHLRPEAATMR